MALVKVKPTSPGRRGMVKVVNSDLYKGRPFAALVEKKSKSAQKAPASVKYLLLTDKAPETKDLKECSHAYAVIAGLRKLSTAGVQGKATRERLMECIKSNKLLNTDMDPSKAISWMTGQLKGKGIIKEVKEAVA